MKFNTKQFVKKVELQFHDPVTVYTIAGHTFQLNLSHNLPIYQELCPLRDSNIARIAKIIGKKYKKFDSINVGANIGDSVAWIKSENATGAVLAVEGDDAYYPLLIENMKQFKKVTLAKSFISEKESTVKATLNRNVPGTMRLDSDENGTEVELQPLDKLLTGKLEKFTTSKYMVVDTDGYDNRVIMGAGKFLKKSHPVVFFEYDPESLRVVGDEGPRVFPFLQKCGYQYLAIYDNNSDFLMGITLDQMDQIMMLHEYFAGRAGWRYMDIVAFSKKDKDLFEEVVSTERAFFKNYRNFN